MTSSLRNPLIPTMVRLPNFEMRGLRKNTPSNFKTKKLIHATIQRCIIHSEEMEKRSRLSQAALSEVLCQRDDRVFIVRRLGATHKTRTGTRDLTPAHEHIPPYLPGAPKHPPSVARLPEARE